MRSVALVLIVNWAVQVIYMELGTARSDSETSEEFFDAEDTTPNRFTKFVIGWCHISLVPKLTFAQNYRKRVTAGETPGGYVHSHIEGSIIDPPSKQYDNVSSKLSSADGRDDHTFLEPKAFGRVRQFLCNFFLAIVLSYVICFIHMKCCT